MDSEIIVIRSLSVQEWHKLAAEGNAPPVRITLSGYSMNPLIRGYRDYVTVVPINGLPSKGDIVLFREPSAGRYVIHRVWSVQNGMILTWGDNCNRPDGWFLPEAILGKVDMIERGRKKIHPDPVKGIKWAKIWHKAGKGYRLYHRYKESILRRIKKARTGENK